MRGHRTVVALLCLGSALLPAAALGGAQQYEPLADSVRAAMAAALRDRDAPGLNFSSADDAHRWLYEMSKRLAGRIPDRASRIQLLKLVHYESLRAGLDPQLVLGVIDVESGFRKYAVSRAGARGYMQVMPFWIRQIGNAKDNLFHTRTNLRYGCVILRHYLDMENGDASRALGRYNGSLGELRYPARVFAALRARWHYDGPTS